MAVVRSAILFSLIVLAFKVNAQKQRVWIDTDIMIGKFKHDVDDGLALILLLQDTNLVIEGISFVHGVDYADKVTDKLLARFALNRKIPTFKGADDQSEFGNKTAAFNGITAALEKGPIKLFALGPMTNIATILHHNPNLASNIEVITYCAGRRPNQHFRPGGSKFTFADYNFDLDPKSSQLVLESNSPMLLSGYDCSDNLFLDLPDFKHLKQSDDKVDRWLYRKMKSWLSLWKTFIGSEKGFIPFDASTVGALLYPEEFEITSSIPARIEVLENDSKNTVKTKTKPYLLVEDGNGKQTVSYCSGTNAEFKKRLLKALNHPNFQ